MNLSVGNGSSMHGKNEMLIMVNRLLNPADDDNVKFEMHHIKTCACVNKSMSHVYCS